MKYERKSSMMVRLAALLVVTMMFTMCFVGGTFAKYTSSATGTDTTGVAKWSIKVNNADIVKTDTFNFNLFNTVKDSNLTDNESDMAPSNGDIIAPGTSGMFSIVIKNDSQVNATYDIEYNVENTNNIPVIFSLGGDDWKNDISNLNVASKAINMGDTATVNVYWKWKYEDSRDDEDTALGKDGTANITVNAKVTATQVD